LREWSFVGVEPAARPLVVHTPSNAEVKGTPFVLKAVEALQSEGLAFDFELVQNVPHDEARAWMCKADIVVDQLLIGATGVVTLEAWALGKPVVVYLREDLFRPFYGTSDLPVANANPDTIEAVLRNLIKDFAWRRHLAETGRRTAETHHDIEQVIDQFIALYETVHAGPPRIPCGTADIDYLVLQTEASVATAKALSKLAVRRRKRPDPASILAWARAPDQTQGQRKGWRQYRKRLKRLMAKLLGRVKD
jgi:lipid A disaccharide synthetase